MHTDWSKWVIGLLGLILCHGCATPGAPSSGPTGDGGWKSLSQENSRAVAVTFDDLPVAGGSCERDFIRTLNQRLLAQLTTHGVPAVGFVNEGHTCAALRSAVLPDVLKMWLDAGNDLGNHTFSHPDLNKTPLEDYQEDIDRGARTVRDVLEASGRQLRYFRYPFLHAGDTPEKKEAVSRFLAERGYAIAPVTLDNQEWVFSRAYVRAKERGDDEGMRRVAAAYVPFMEEVFAFFEAWSCEVVGYEIPQILLLHANELNADHFGELVEMIRRRGYRFISLDNALRDPAYRQPDTYVGPRGISWLHRWAVGKGLELKGEPREPDWVRQYPDS